MALQYPAPTVPAQWANDHNTHDAVATAIHAIAGGKRTPELIWDDPTPAEWDHVAMAVENYVAEDLYPAEPDGRYAWGQEAFVIPAHVQDDD